MSERRPRLRYSVNATLVAFVVAAALHAGLFAEEHYYGYLDLFGLKGHHAAPVNDEVIVDYAPELADDLPPAMTQEEIAALEPEKQPKDPAAAEQPPTPDDDIPPIPEAAPEPEKQPEEPAAKQDQPSTSLPRMKAVEVDDDEHVVDEEPADAQFLSDKNRNVAEETRATETNLKREMKGAGE